MVVSLQASAFATQSDFADYCFGASPITITVCPFAVALNPNNNSAQFLLMNNAVRHTIPAPPIPLALKVNGICIRPSSSGCRSRYEFRPAVPQFFRDHDRGPY